MNPLEALQLGSQWIQVERDISTLTEMIELRPDVVVGIVKGGVIPARLLAQRLEVDEMYDITINKVNSVDRKVVTDINVDLTGKDVLLVDDVLETGFTLLSGVEYLTGKGALVRTAALYTTALTPFQPDYSLGRANEVPSFPWE